MQTPQPLAFIGLDMAKLSFEACLLRTEGKPQHKSFSNSSDGFAKLLRWVKHLAAESTYRFCMEATGAYSQALALFLAEADLYVSVVNPYRTKHARLASGNQNKTDPADARALAEYAKKENPPLWRRAAAEVRTLVGLLRRLQTLKDHLIQEQNRLAEPGLLPEVVASLKLSTDFVQKEIARLEQQIHDHIKGHPALQADRDLLVSIPGIGELTAAWILAELADVTQFPSAQSAAAYAGLAPLEYRSGTSVKRATHLSKRGNARLRRALYMPALSAVRFNPLLKALYERMMAAGRPRLVAIGAAMRKLLMIAYGVLKSRKKFCLPEAENVQAAA